MNCAHGQKLCSFLWSAVEEQVGGDSAQYSTEAYRGVMLVIDAAQVGIDAADTTACLIGRLQDGSGIYGCAALPPVR